MNFFKKFYQKILSPNIWARPEMPLTFRAGVMPGKSSDERTFRVKNVLRNNRVTLHGFAGEHRESAFEPVSFSRRQ